MLNKIKLKKYYLLIILIILIVLVFVTYHFQEKDNCSENIAVIPITGEIISSPRYNTDGSIDKSTVVSLDLISQIRKANKDKEVKAIVFIINSPGGDAESAQEVSTAIKEVHKPTVSLIRTTGDSSAYWIASATGRIFALPISNVADIGVTVSYLDNVNKNKNDGLTFNKLSYGKYKDMMNPDKPLTPDEQKLLMEQIDKVAQVFINAVAENRHLPLEKVQALANGSEILGQDAIKLGLIDELGSFADVDRYLSKTLNKNINVCVGNSEEETKDDKSN